MIYRLFLVKEVRKPVQLKHSLNGVGQLGVGELFGVLELEKTVAAMPGQVDLQNE